MFHRAPRRCVAALFRPATSLIGRLRYAQKFAVVGLVLLVPLGLTTQAVVEQQNTQISSSAAERQGLRYLRAVINLAGDLAQARRFAVSKGQDSSVDLATDVARVDELHRRLNPMLRVDEQWQQARRLVLAAYHLQAQSKQDRFQAYNNASDALLTLLVRVGDRSNLIHDPDLDAYYLADALQFRLPALCDNAGRIADRVELAAAEPPRDAFDTFVELGRDVGLVSNARTLIGRQAATIVAQTGDAQVRRTIQAQFRQLDELTVAMTDRLTIAVQNRSLIMFPSMSADAVRVTANTFATVALTELDRLLQVRIDRLSTRARQIEVSAGLAVLLAVYLFVGFYRSVSSPIHRIVETLRAVAGGDLTRRVRVDTRDELSFVATVLNETVAETEAATERLAIQATRDALTGLPNRAAVLDRLDHALARSARSGSLMAVLFVDLDRFKLINDSLGHEAGDVVLCTVAERLRSNIRGADTVARLAGDEFVIVSEDLHEADEVIAVAERVAEAICRPIEIVQEDQRREVAVAASIGVAFATGITAPTADNLLRNADVAMYRAKHGGRGQIAIFDDSLRTTIEYRLETQRDLRLALDAGQLRVHYQPVADARTGEILGFEALARWAHPARGLLLPGDFMDVAKENGLIIPLGAQILADACRQGAGWRGSIPGGGHLQIAVNISAAQFDHPGLVPTVAAALADAGLPPEALWLEITESSILSDIDVAVDTLNAIAALGVHLVIDDFGTGNASLTYLRQVPVETIKINETFVAGLGRNREDEAIVELITGFARTLGLSTIAEGVETEAQLDLLRSLGCTGYQGRCLAPPLPAEQVGDIVRRHAASHVAG